MNIEIISASPRKNSATVRVAKYLQEVLSAKHKHHTGLIDMREINLPPLQNVYTSPEAAPEEFRHIAERMFKANGFILVTPEYNGSYAAPMKNLLDHFPKQNHKPFGIVTASPGALGGIRATQQMLLLIAALFGIASPYMLVVPKIDSKFNEQGQLIDGAFESNVHQFVTEFLWLAEKLCNK
jgi:NAD(P)H-dependent FMN reductase